MVVVAFEKFDSWFAAVVADASSMCESLAIVIIFSGSFVVFFGFFSG